MAVSRAFTLSEIALSVTISSAAVGVIEAGTPASALGQIASPFITPPVLVTEVTITNRVNDLSEASIALGYSSKAGLALLQKLFPRENSEGAYFAEVEVVLGPAGPLSYEPLQGGLLNPIFKGVIVGFSHKKSGQGISFVVNAFSSIYPLTQIPVASPGFHPTSGMSLGTVAMVGNATFAGGEGLTETTASSLLGELGDQQNPVNALKKIITQVLGTWESDVGEQGLGTALASALQKYGLPKTKQVVSDLMDTIIPVGKLDNIIFERAADSVILNITQTMLRSNGMTFWAYILAVFDQYGIDLVCMGDKCFAFALNPLGDAPITNLIGAIEEAAVEIRDFPFDSPTRCLVIGPGIQSFAGESGSAVGEYPKGEELTSQEAQTGIKTIIVQAPSFLAETVSASAAKVYRDQDISLHLQGGAYVSQLVKDLNATKKQDDLSFQSSEREAYNEYAKYILMKQKFRQRTGSCVCRLRTDIIPGFCVRIEDPITGDGKSISTIFGYITEVTHTISCQSEQAQTSMALSHVRYDGEVPDDLRVNPMYPESDTNADAFEVLAGGVGL